MAIERFHEDDLMSKYVIHNGTVYMSGQVADDPTQDFEGQLSQILAKLDVQFGEIGIDRTHVLSVMVWIDDYRKLATSQCDLAKMGASRRDTCAQLCRGKDRVPGISS